MRFALHPPRGCRTDGRSPGRERRWPWAFSVGGIVLSGGGRRTAGGGGQAPTRGAPAQQPGSRPILFWETDGSSSPCGRRWAPREAAPWRGKVRRVGAAARSGRQGGDDRPSCGLPCSKLVLPSGSPGRSSRTSSSRPSPLSSARPWPLPQVSVQLPPSEGQPRPGHSPSPDRRSRTPSALCPLPCALLRQLLPATARPVSPRRHVCQWPGARALPVSQRKHPRRQRAARSRRALDACVSLLSPSLSSNVLLPLPNLSYFLGSEEHVLYSFSCPAGSPGHSRTRCPRKELKNDNELMNLFGEYLLRTCSVPRNRGDALNKTATAAPPEKLKPEVGVGGEQAGQRTGTALGGTASYSGQRWAGGQKDG